MVMLHHNVEMSRERGVREQERRSLSDVGDLSLEALLELAKSFEGDSNGVLTNTTQEAMNLRAKLQTLQHQMGVVDWLDEDTAERYEALVVEANDIRQAFVLAQHGARERMRVQLRSSFGT
jgi:hypothetical protein